MRHRPSGNPRRASSPGALSTLGAATLALAVLTSACSASDPGRADNPGHPAGTAGSAGSPDSAGTDAASSSGAQAAPTAGVLDTDPADPPIINPTLQPGKPVPTGYRDEPTTLKPPASWDKTSWLNLVHAAAGAEAVANDSHDRHSVNDIWKWSAGGVTSLEAGVLSDGQDHPTTVTCSAEGFDPAGTAAAAKIRQVLELCAETGLSGASAQTARTWIGDQVAPMLGELGTAPKGRQSISAAPAFGGATYQLFARYVSSSYGYSIQLLVW
jgi:hypothetical protein